MDVDEMVDAALAGFDQGEGVTLPSLPDAATGGGSTRARDCSRICRASTRVAV